MNKKIQINIQNKSKPKFQSGLFCADTFEQFRKIMLDNIPADQKLNYIFMFGDKKYLLQNQEDYEEIKKLNMTHDGYLDVRSIENNDQFENRKQIQQNLINESKKGEYHEELCKEDLRLIYSTPCKQFFSHKNILTCPCSTEKKQENCMFCNNQKQIQYEQYQQELDQAMKDFLINNLYKLEQFIIGKFNLKQDQMNSYLQWISFHNELMDFQNLKSFNFVCIKCKSGCSKQIMVYVKQQKFPQSPVCMNCYENLNSEERKKYHRLVEDQVEDQIPKPPNIMQRHSQGN